MRDAADLFEARYSTLFAKGEGGWYPSDGCESVIAEWHSILEPFLERPGTCVELGCGAGNLALSIAARRWDVLGVDISPTAVMWARSRALDAKASARFVCHDLGQDLPSEFANLEGRCDLVIDGDCLHHTFGPQRLTFLGNAFRLLSESGVFVVKTLAGEPPAEDWPKLAYEPQLRASSIQGVPITYHGEPGDILEELKTAGFSVGSFDILRRSPSRAAEMLVVVAGRAPRASPS